MASTPPENTSHPQPRPGLEAIIPYTPGKAKSRTSHGLVHKLSSNESALGASPTATDVFHAAAGAISRYPDSDATSLRNAIAEVHGLPTDQLVIGAGSDEIIQLLIRGYAGEGAAIVQSAHGFSYYHLAAAAAGVATVYAAEKNLTADVDALVQSVTAQTKLLFLANPNNPTGTVLMRPEIERLRSELRDDVILVLDGAYAEYMDEEAYTDGVDLVRKAIESSQDNVVMTRTFSKIYGLGGLRVGWAYGPPSIIGILERIRSPFNVGGPALAAATAAMRDQDFVRENREQNTEERQRVSGALGQLGYDVVPSHGNFVLFRASSSEDDTVAAAEAAKLLEGLEQHGVLIRSAASSGLPAYLRVSIGSTESLDVFLEAMHALTERDA